jgi:hypothetical protein
MVLPREGVYWGRRRTLHVSEARRLGGSLMSPPHGLDELVAYLCDRSAIGCAEMSGKIMQLRKAKKYRNATSRSKGRRGNDAYRVREHLTEPEMDKLLATLKDNRHGHRD